MRFKPVIIWMIVAFLTTQQTIIFGAVMRRDNTNTILSRAGSVYADARQNTRILRVTDENDARSANVISTTTFNLDATRFVVNLDGVATLYRFNSAAFNILKEGPLFDRESLDSDSLQWSAADENRIFGLDTSNGTARIAAYDTVTRRSQIVKDFSTVLGHGEAHHLSKSPTADNRFAFAWRDAGANAWRAVIVWDAATDNVYSFDLNDPAAGVADFINANFNQSGEALVVNGATTRVWRFMAESQIESVQLAPVGDAMTAQSASRDALSRANELANTMPRQEVSHDGRFTLYSAGSGNSRQDVFIATVAPSAGASSMAWANLVNCSADGNTVQKTGGSNSSDDATATSLDSITEGDAYVEFTAVDTDKERVCGLSNSNAVHSSASDINFGIRLTSTRKAMIVENGVTRGKVKYKPGNVFRVAVESGAVHYYKNGGLVYTSSVRPAYSMLVTASLVNTMAAINDATVFGATATAVVSISPSRTALTTGQTAQFSAVITSAQIKGLTWSASGGTITSAGLYTAPATAGTYTVTATLLSSPVMTATATVTVTSGADTTPPVISAVTSSGLTASGATINWTTNEASDSTVEYGKTTAYGASATDATKVTSHSLVLSGLSAGTAYHYHVKSRDAAGNLATSGDFTFATSAAGGGTGGGGTGAAPVISVLSTGSVTTSGAAITWTTDKQSDTQVEYGTSASYGSSTALASAMVTNHSATLTGLASGTTYHFRVKSHDSAGNLVTSGDQAFVTAVPAGSGATSSGSTSGTDPLKTDKNVYPEPAPPALPAAGGTLVDPTFGTTILRVTDERDGTSNYNSYSYWPSLNRNNTRLVIFVNDGDPTLYDFDPVNFRISNKRALFRATLPGGGYPWNDDVNWSGSDPDVIFCHSGMKIYSYNVVSNAYTLIHDFSGQAPGANLFQMSKSIDDNAFGCTLKDANWNVVGYMAYQRAQNNLYYVQTTAVDEVQIDKSGLYLTILTGDQGTASAIESKIINLQTRSVANITDGAPDFSPGHHDSGSNLVVGNDNWNNALNARQLSNPHQFYNVLNMGNDWSQSNHVSLLDDGDGWLLVSFFVATSLPNSGLYKNELVLVATDGSQRVRRVAHHHSVYRDYWDTPRADISRDGQFAIFTSNWGSSSRRDVFIVKIPPTTGGGTGGGGDTTPPVVSAIAASNVTAASATVNWASNESGDTQIDYGTTASYGSSTTLSSTRVTSHSAALGGLAAGTVYHYRVKSRDAAGNLAVSSDLVLTTLGAASGGTGGGGTGGGGTGGTGARQNVVWTGIVNCTATGNNLQKTAGQTDGADAGARSQQSLASGDGYLEFAANETSKLRFCGLTRTVSGTDFAGIDYAIKLTDYAVAEVREANVYKGETPYKTGDVFRVAVEGGVVKYYKNGTVFYTSSRAVSYPLVVDASFIALNSTIGNAVIASTTGTLATSIIPQTLSFGATTLAVVSAPANAVAPVTGVMNAGPMNREVNEEVNAARPFRVATVIVSPVSLFGLRSGNAGWQMFASNHS